MSLSPVTPLAAIVQAQIAAAMDRDLAMMMESGGNPVAGAKTAAPGPIATTQSPATPPAQSAIASAPLAEPLQGLTSEPPAVAAMTQAMDTARATAAGRQASMAPLFADLVQALASPELPAPVKAAVRQILAFQTPLDKPPTGQAIARAVAQSGLFLEAHLAAAGDSPPEPDLKAALLTLRQALATPDKATAIPPPRAATAPGLPTSAQPTAARDPAAATPDTARASAPGAPSPTAPLLIRAIDQALVRPSAAAPLAAALAQALESPSLPVAVRAAIGLVLAQQAAPAGTPAPDAEVTPPPALKAALMALREALAAPEGDRTSPPPRLATAAPPSRDAATAAQTPARGSLPQHADVATITEALARGVDQAVARQTLHQLASLPDGAAQAWMFELPLATPQGAGVAQFEIDRDGPGSASQEGVDGWRVRFSIDLEPLGPVHVHLRAGGGRTCVNVWAERPTSLAPLRSLGGELSRALQAEVRVQAGAPSQPVPQPGQFLDAST